MAPARLNTPSHLQRENPMPTIFFTADEHYDHKNILAHQPNRAERFGCVEEMQEALIAGHNELVGEKDTVYHLGDIAWKDPRPFVARLNGAHVLIRGNHDYWHKKAKLTDCFAAVHQVLKVKQDGVLLWLSHYPHLSWPMDAKRVLETDGRVVFAKPK